MSEWLINIDKYLKYLENIQSASVHTLRSYRVDLERAFQELPENAAESEILTHLRQHQSSWIKYSAATKNRKAASLKSFLNWLYETKQIEKELAPQIICVKVPQKIPHFLSVDEAIAVLKSYSIEMKPQELLDKTLFSLIYGSGLRVSEACTLKWENVDWQKQQLLITRKGNKDQWVPAPGFTFEVLQKWKKHNADDVYVFGPHGLSTRTAYEIVRKRGAQAGLLKPLHPHALRHSFATHLLSSGADLRSLQELLGHSSLSATQKYTHISTHELGRMIESRHPLGIEKKKGA